jgi:hypothetical protein
MTTEQKEFGKWRGQWLDQIHTDPTLTGDYFRVLYALASRNLNQKTRTGMPGNVVLAESAHVNVRTVRRAIVWAAQQGHLSITEPKGTWPRILSPVLKGTNCPLEQGTNCIVEVSRVDKGEDRRGDKVFEVPPQDQQGGAGTLMTLKTLKVREGQSPPSSRIPSEWKVSEADKTYALERGLDQAQIDNVADQFQYYFLAKGESSCDWSASWKSWIIREITWNKRAANIPRREKASTNVLLTPNMPQWKLWRDHYVANDKAFYIKQMDEREAQAKPFPVTTLFPPEQIAMAA